MDICTKIIIILIYKYIILMSLNVQVFYERIFDKSIDSGQ